MQKFSEKFSKLKLLAIKSKEKLLFPITAQRTKRPRINSTKEVTPSKTCILKATKYC
jgi:hypothetical protein